MCIKIISFVVISTSLCTSVCAVNQVPFSEDIARDLEEEAWSSDQKQCLETTVRMLKNVQNLTLWATWAWDATQINPSGILTDSQIHVGNFDQCLEPPWSLEAYPELRMQYCLAEIQVEGRKRMKKRKDAGGGFAPYDNASEYLHTPTIHRPNLSSTTWGVCVPASCDAESVKIILSTLLSRSQLGAMTSEIRIYVDQTCQVAGEGHRLSLGNHVFFMLLLSLVAAALISSYLYDPSDTCASLKSDAISLTGVTRCFSLQENYKKLVKEEASEIRVLNGIRVLTSAIVVLMHNVLLTISAHILLNGNGTEKLLQMSPFRWFTHLDLIVDTFFMMAGLLLAKSFVPKIGTKMENPLKQLFKRYVRLAPSYAMVVLFLSTAFWHSGSGPLWPRLATTEVNSCRKNWWLNLLMASNYINSAEQCFVFGWSIPSDYHFAILGTALFHLYNRHRGLSVSVYSALLVVSLVLPGVYAYMYDYPHVILSHLDGLRDLRNNEAFTTLYIASHMRLSSYFIGIVFGCFIAVYKPSQFRNIIPQSWSIAFTCLGVGLMLVILDYGTQERSALVSAVYSSLNRPLWAVGVGIVVVSCLYGTVPIVNSFLCWDVFRPLSRLTYGIYLVHAVIYKRNIFSARSPFFIDVFQVIIEGIGVLCVSTLISLFLWMLVETPAINVYNLCANSKWRVPKKAAEASSLKMSSLLHNNNTVKKD